LFNFGHFSKLLYSGYQSSLKNAFLIQNTKVKRVEELKEGEFVKIQGKTFTKDPIVSFWKKVRCISYKHEKGRKFEEMTKIKQNSSSSNSNLSTTQSGSNTSGNSSSSSSEKDKWEIGFDVEEKHSDEKDLYITDSTGNVLIENYQNAYGFSLYKIDETFEAQQVSDQSSTSKRYLGTFEREYALLLDQTRSVYGTVSRSEGNEISIHNDNKRPFIITERKQDDIVNDYLSSSSTSYFFGVVLGLISVGILGRSSFVIYNQLKKK